MQAVDERAQRASMLLRRQMILTALGLGVLVLVIVFAQTAEGAPKPRTPVDTYLQAHKPREPGSLRLAYVQLFVAAAVALMTLGHAAHVVAFVFRRKVS